MRGFRIIAAGALLVTGAAHAENELHVGAQVGVISLVRPLSLEVLAKTPRFGLGLGYGAVPGFIGDALLSAVGAKKGSTTANLDDFSAVELDLRYFPFSGAFFVGASGGRQHVQGTVTDSSTVLTGRQTASLEVTSWFATPRLGWLWRFDSGFTIGFDVGVQLALASSKTVVMPSQASQSQKDSVNNLVDAASKIPLPALNLRIGWLF
jgi:hypothetical protein